MPKQLLEFRTLYPLERETFFRIRMSRISDRNRVNEKIILNTYAKVRTYICAHAMNDKQSRDTNNIAKQSLIYMIVCVQMSDSQIFD